MTIDMTAQLLPAVWTLVTFLVVSALTILGSGSQS